MKNEIRQYRPAFFEGFENETVLFDSLEELVKIPWVANFSNSPNFHQFSASDDALMAEYLGGREWWVVGFLKNPVAGLPKWNRGQTPDYCEACFTGAKVHHPTCPKSGEFCGPGGS